uniref:Putative secreted protein n=1 Tax=Ixodes ricinus TaxID=34613 RepID=A0A147BC25_IXORI
MCSMHTVTFSWLAMTSVYFTGFERLQAYQRHSFLQYEKKIFAYSVYASVLSPHLPDTSNFEGGERTKLNFFRTKKCCPCQSEFGRPNLRCILQRV